MNAEGEKRQKTASSELAELADRIRLAREALGLDQRAMAEKLGAALRTYAGYERGESEPRGTHLKRLVDLGVDPAFLFQGGGNPLVRRSSMNSTVLPSAEPTPSQLVVPGSSAPRPPEGFVLVPRYDIEASAGAGALAGEENVLDYMAFQETWVRRALRVDPSRLALITASGDSMEPVIRPGDLLLVDMSVERVMDDSIYLVAIDDFLLVKRVQKLLKGLIVRSDNPNYAPMTLGPDEVDEVRIRGRIRWIGRLI